jgi:NADH dehydrogenase
MATRRVTIFGGSGFIGRHLVRRLAARGDIIQVAVRDTEGALFLKPMGDVGQITPVAASILDEPRVAAAVAGADAVVNLVGILYERGRQTFYGVHQVGARRVASAAAAAGITRVVHVSALGADRMSPSLYARTKWAGEQAVLATVPEATIVRPSVVFGPEDDFFNKFAAMARLLPALPVMGVRWSGPTPSLFGSGGTRFQPVYVGDVAEAIARILDDPATRGRTYELGGPRVYTFKELMELILAETGRRRLLMPMPGWLASLQASLLGLLPKPPLTRDQVRLLERDNVVSGCAPGLADLGVTPTAAEAILPTYMDRFRVGGRYNPPAP